MKQLIYLILASFIRLTSQAQVNGYAKDAQGAPIKSATISLLAAKDSAIIKLALTKENGAYTFLKYKRRKIFRKGRDG